MMIRKIIIGLLFISCIQRSSAMFDEVTYWAREGKFGRIKVWLDEEKKMVDSLENEDLYHDTCRAGMQEALMGMEICMKSMEIEEYFRVPLYKKRAISKEDAEAFLIKVFKIVPELCFKADLAIYQKLELIFIKYPSLLKYKDAMGWTLLHEAAHTNNTMLLLFLLKMGADANAQTTGVLDTPLHLAVRAHCKEARYILEHRSGVARHMKNVLNKEPFEHKCQYCPKIRFNCLFF